MKSMWVVSTPIPKVLFIDISTEMKDCLITYPKIMNQLSILTNDILHLLTKEYLAVEVLRLKSLDYLYLKDDIEGHSSGPSLLFYHKDQALCCAAW